MNNLNSILIEGNLVRDAEIRATPKGTAACTFTIATNRYFRQESGMEKETGFFNVETWAKLAETAACKEKKGRGKGCGQAEAGTLEQAGRQTVLKSNHMSRSTWNSGRG